MEGSWLLSLKIVVGETFWWVHLGNVAEMIERGHSVGDFLAGKAKILLGRTEIFRDSAGETPKF